MMFISVDLPEPDSPTMDVSSPSPDVERNPVQYLKLVLRADVVLLYDIFEMDDDIRLSFLYLFTQL